MKGNLMLPYFVKFDDLLTSTYRSIIKVEGTMLRSLSGSDLTIGEMHMLESIGRDRAGSTITDIALSQGITLPSVTTAIQKLVKKGYVVKEKSASDARSVRVLLTDMGRRAQVAHRYFHRQMIKALTRDMTDEERSILLGALAKLDGFLRERAEAGSMSFGGDAKQ